MSSGTLAIPTLLPILSVILFLVVLRWPASRAMPIGLAEDAVMRKTLLPLLHYALMTGAIGYGLVKLSNDVLNAGFVVAAPIVAAFMSHVVKFNARPFREPARPL